MSITRSYNKYNNTYYVYDTQYVWSEEKQKKVPKRTCIGKWDEETNQVIPTGSEGRLRKKAIKTEEIAAILSESNDNGPSEIAGIFTSVASNLKSINLLLSELASNLEAIGAYLDQQTGVSENQTSGTKSPC